MNFSSNGNVLTPIDTQIISVSQYGSIIEQTYFDFLLPPQQGIYKFGDLHPSIVNNKNYYTYVKTDKGIIRTPVENFNTLNEAVLDEMDRVIIPAFMMKQKEKYLSNHPTIPARGIEIIKLLIENHIARMSPWASKGNYVLKMCGFFKAENSDIVEEQYLERLCESLICQVDAFIGRDVWNIYFVKFRGFDICIEKCEDYRIYDWTIKQNQQIEDGLC